MSAAPGLPRRGLAGVLALPWAVSGPVQVVQEPGDADAALLRLCAEFHHAHRSSYAAGDDPSWETWLDRRTEASNAIEDAAQPTTDAGRRALGLVALVLFNEAVPTGMQASDYERMAHRALMAFAGLPLHLFT